MVEHIGLILSIRSRIQLSWVCNISYSPDIPNPNPNLKLKISGDQMWRDEMCSLAEST